MLKTYNALLLVCFLTLASGCETARQHYYWGDYEDLLYAMYAKPGTATPEVQIETLTRDLSKAESQGMSVGPGVYAHLGFMYSMTGNIERAEAAFNEEKLRFPESAVLIEGMMARARVGMQKRAGETP